MPVLTIKITNVVSVIIPVYNSRNRIISLVQRLKKISIKGTSMEIIIIDDCSIEPTKSLVANLNNVTIIRHKKNTGKGGALQTGFAKATGNILVIQDDDLEYDPLDIPQLVKPILEGKADVVFGSRRLQKSNAYSSWLYYFGGVLVDTVISIIIKKRITDAITGAKALSKSAYIRMQPFQSKGFGIEAEIAAKTIKHKLRLLEIPIKYYPRTHKQGKNIRWHHAFSLIKAAFIYR